MTIYRNFIDGQWLESSSDKTVLNINPANVGDIIGTIKLSACEEPQRKFV